MVLCVLARIEGAPQDASGLSLFIVPKYLVNPDGSLGPRNDYSVAGLEQKLGLHGSPTVALDFTNLLGEMKRTVEEFENVDGLADLAGDLSKRVDLLGAMGLFFADCFKQDGF